MKYFYLTADGTTAGPESLATLGAMMDSGKVSLATLVVPAGGEDWTPLARVLRYFYQDAAGATAGPVAFSELDRLCQIHAIPAAAWVVEESGTDWKAAAAVLGAGGVVLPSAAPAPRLVHAAARPPSAATAAHAHAAPHAPAGRRVVVRHRTTGGIARLPYAVVLVLVLVLSIFGPAAYFRHQLKTGVSNWHELGTLIQEYHIFSAVCGLIALIAVTVLGMLRIRNVGWHRVLIFILLAPGIFGLVVILLRTGNVGLLLALGLLGLMAFIFQCLLLAMPPGFARHRRLDSTAWTIFAVEVLVIGGLFTWAKIEEDRRKEREQNTPSAAEVP